MILPTPRQDRRTQRVVATAASAVFMVGLYGGLRGMPVPALGSSSAHVRELGALFLERHIAPPPPEAADDATGDDPAADASPTAIMDQEVGSALDALVARFEGAGLGGPPDAGRRTQGQDASGGLDPTAAASRFDELFGGGDNVAAAAPAGRTPAGRTPARRDAAEGARITVGPPRVRSEAGGERAEEPVTIAIEGPPQRDLGRGAAPEVEIHEYEAENLDRFEVDALARWMSAHAADLPVGVKAHLNYQPSFLTAATPFTSGERQFELYLMYNTSLRELHIVLVEDERSVYLIDRGFQAQGRSLREGTVQRRNGEIVTVNSQQRDASTDRAREFYNIFLSWWDAARLEVGG